MGLPDHYRVKCSEVPAEQRSLLSRRARSDNGDSEVGRQAANDLLIQAQFTMIMNQTSLEIRTFGLSESLFLEALK